MSLLSFLPRTRRALLLVALSALPALQAEVLSLHVSDQAQSVSLHSDKPDSPNTTSPSPAAPGAPITSNVFQLGSATNPVLKQSLTADPQSLLLNGQPLIPVMGEFHYSRYPAAEWRRELAKMKAGGITIISTYVFWVHHEEIEGHWVWSGNKDLHAFLSLCQELGLKVAVRCGPWCHGEVRNGAIPDWVLDKGLKVRSDDPAYLTLCTEVYSQIATQLKGLLWKDGGPVVAIQLENEFGGPASHLLNLKRIAREAGLDVPLYTRTGWPLTATPVPYGEILPLFGAYPEGFWDRSLTAMPGNYWAAFRFLKVRTDTAIANEQLGKRAAEDEADANRYPYLTCELGGGMESAYHRRLQINPEDIDSIALIKLGSGGNLPGYYMYHGGSNPDSLGGGTLMECQDSRMTNWNDMPQKGYDFYAPLGEFGQVRPHYHLLRRLHLMAADFGPQLARMPASFPDKTPGAKDDLSTLRWSLRSKEGSGFLFVSNHQRGAALPPHPDTHFTLYTGTGAEQQLPSHGLAIPSGARFVWPVNLPLGTGLTLVHATVQPLCVIHESDRTSFVFFQIGDLPIELKLHGGRLLSVQPQAVIDHAGEDAVFTKLKASRNYTVELLDADKNRIRILVLSEADSLRAWKGRLHGQEQLFLSNADWLLCDKDQVTLHFSSQPEAWLKLYPGSDHPVSLQGQEQSLAFDDGFQSLPLSLAHSAAQTLAATPTRAAGPARQVQLGKSKSPVAAAPVEADFKLAAEWSLALPGSLDFGQGRDYLVRVHYKGDVLRLLVDDHFTTDEFWNGRPFEFSLARFLKEHPAATLKLQILPFDPKAPIYLEKRAEWLGTESNPVLSLDTIELIPQQEISLQW